MSALMTRTEREALQRLIRDREKVQKSAAKQRSADILADFENQIAAVYSFDDDAVWAEAAKEAKRIIASAQKRIADRCRELGIPQDFAPGLELNWRHRGYHNSVKERREELRRAARAQVEALERKAIVEIEKASVEALTEIALAGLTSEAAQAFIKRLPTVESLMPALSYEELAGESDQPIVEQLLTPNALRQRRYRERQKALRDGGVTPQPALRYASDDEDEDDDETTP
jgi:hypothetical protein